MSSMAFNTKRISTNPDTIAPDGSEVRVLCATPHGGMAVFRLPTGAVSRAVAHRTVEEIWYVIAGGGRIWRKRGDDEEITELAPGVSLTIPSGTHFQFRCDAAESLEIVAVTMPPWPGADEAYAVDGKWQSAISAEGREPGSNVTLTEVRPGFFCTSPSPP
jgi:mannose-6-phosphate isomerase-like protein (cupin superfamily)